MGGANSEGYSHALMKVWSSGSRKVHAMPAKSSLCRMRARISYLFFKDLFEKLMCKADGHRKTWLGLRIYAIDGQMLTLPRSKEITQAGFNGRAVSTYRESYYPKGFLTHCYDVVTGVSKDFRFTNRLHEQQDAREMIAGLERASLVIYDRLYFSLAMVKAHYSRGNHFLFRCRSNACKEVSEFLADPERPLTMSFLFGQRRRFEVHLIRIKNKKTGEDDVYATSLPLEMMRPGLIRKLYRLRWEVETSFRELTGITKAEQWHTKSVNGIYQELYARFWLINYVKLTTASLTDTPVNPLRDDYEKPNFKLLYNFTLRMFPKILRRNPRVFEDFERLRKRSLERRRHESRRYPREIKRPQSPYNYNNCVWNLGS